MRRRGTIVPSSFPSEASAMISHRLTSMAVVSFLLVPATGAFGQAIRVRPDFAITDDAVAVVRPSGNTLYLGGNFTHVGRHAGGAVPVQASGGDPIPHFDKVRGIVHAIAADGQGGWFLGGEFDLVGATPRLNLAHIAPDGSVDAWNPAADGAVRVLVRDASTVYVGGDFAHAGGQTRSRLAAIDATT